VADKEQHGYFINLASNNAMKLSNTLLLEQYFSSIGLCIEANQKYWYKLHVGLLQKYTVLGAVVGNYAKEAISFVMMDVFDSMVNAKFDNKKNRKMLQWIDSWHSWSELLNSFIMFHLQSTIY
jgi:hypothetical protein